MNTDGMEYVELSEEDKKALNDFMDQMEKNGSIDTDYSRFKDDLNGMK